MVSFLLALIILLSALTGCQKANAQYTHTPGFELSSEAVFVMDVNTNDIIYEKNADKLMFPAALTQMLTALVAMEKTQDLNSEVTVPDGFSPLQGSESSPIGTASAGETFIMQDLLHCVIMNTDNTAATLIAQAAGGGDINSFISLLNEKAKVLGTKSTNFINPTGIHDTHNYTTARDMAAIAAAAVSNTAYMEIASKTAYTFAADNQSSRNVTSNLSILSTAGEYPAGTKEIKFSAGEDTGSSLVCVLEQDGLKIVAVLMGAPYSVDGAAVYADMKKLLGWASSTCVLAIPPKSGDTILTIGVSGNFNIKELPLKTEKNLSDLLPKKAQLKDIQLFCCIPSGINKPVNSGEVLGKADIIYNGKKTNSVNLLAVGSVTEAGKQSSVPDILLTVGIVFLSLFLLLLIIRQINIIRYRKKRQRALEQRRRQMRRELEKGTANSSVRRK
ncbi:D-alanyl-D-alanine carboxypeptidase family protein [Acetanaerobacterium elongatum]|uniref:D-alanyl-D-alanine carboxypeptidase family protein n=1 Tax=Acetanaerobacterium elongatum TaxID=258515 RepID=UPI001FA80058|nr:serine hydrolase [Acetanaerobacterium elongatum]